MEEGLSSIISAFEARFGGKKIPASQVLENYRRLSPHGNKDLVQLVENISSWRLCQLNPYLVNNSHFWFSDSLPPDHPDRILTDNGRYLLLPDVAQRHIDHFQELGNSQYARNIEFFIAQLEQGIQLPPIIAVTGRLKPDLYLIDGNTRSLSATVLWLSKGKSTFPELQAYIGRKPYIF